MDSWTDREADKKTAKQTDDNEDGDDDDAIQHPTILLFYTFKY